MQSSTPNNANSQSNEQIRTSNNSNNNTNINSNTNRANGHRQGHTARQPNNHEVPMEGNSSAGRPTLQHYTLNVFRRTTCNIPGQSRSLIPLPPSSLFAVRPRRRLTHNASAEERRNHLANCLSSQAIDITDGKHDSYGVSVDRNQIRQ